MLKFTGLRVLHCTKLHNFQVNLLSRDQLKTCYSLSKFQSNLHYKQLSRFYTVEREGYAGIEKIKSNLKPFLMKVHPDFFAQDVDIQKQNEKSLKQLNSMLDQVEEYMNKPPGLIQLEKSKISRLISVSFFVRQDSRSDNGTAEKPSLRVKLVRVTHQMPAEYYESQFERKCLQQEFYEFLNKLLLQSGLEELKHIGEVHEEEHGDCENQTIEQKTSKIMGAPRYNVKSAIEMFMDKHYPVSAMASDKLGGRWEELAASGDPVAQMASGVLELKDPRDLNEQNIHYDFRLTGEQRAAALTNIRLLWHSELIPTDLPVYITHEKNLFLPPSELLAGFLTIPWIFERDALQEYLAKNLTSIARQRYSMRHRLHCTESIFKKMKLQCSLGSMETECDLDISYSSSSRLVAIVTSAGFHKYCYLFEGMNWVLVSDNSHVLRSSEQTMTIISSDTTIQSPNYQRHLLPKYVPKSDTLFIPASITSESFGKWFASHYKLLSIRHVIFPTARWKRLVSQLIKSLSQLIGVGRIVFAGVVAIQKKKQLHSLSLLKKYRDTLKTLELAEFTLVIGCVYRLDIKKKLLILPYNFDMQKLKEFLLARARNKKRHRQPAQRSSRFKSSDTKSTN